MSREYYERIRKEERRYICVLVIIAVFTMLGIAAIALVMRSLERARVEIPTIDLLGQPSILARQSLKLRCETPQSWLPRLTAV
jgi:uncharacterized membrane protein